MKAMKKIRNVFVASLLGLSLMAAAPAFAATNDSYTGSNNAVSQVQTTSQQQSNQMRGVSAKDPGGANLTNNFCPTGIQVPSPMGTW